MPAGVEEEGDGDNLSCDLVDGDGPLTTESLCKQKLPGLIYITQCHGAMNAAILGVNL